MPSAKLRRQVNTLVLRATQAALQTAKGPALRRAILQVAEQKYVLPCLELPSSGYGSQPL